ncbi:TPA: ROK family transcriptional regulator [Klebsiella pneumoniae]|mgnify:CR=1 FL=1|uniref:ROK family transcriptional regulator n=1 Tax=Klebsiella pneumoniae TaxID=573 RepID=UPI0013303C71|nr:ROK family transcriptional regulator [Klebsiella pneumoniae]MCP6272210.1 ROK family transcriptional regulator [Klebsiella pneumoniae]MDZ0104899.1 ROK family transcriptional regulator [Klebsiella pneumoniae]UDD13840.1 ROK family transcriptional regulator [Klebsiella pneumoniae]HBQ8656669.1 ROK family transcriptional regulator [Klebsiella pneumoniae]HBR1248165.1 ROK family transcriptional regulator [Klebsiella pneumoniae]
MQIAGLNNQTVRQHNRRAIMTLIWRYKRLSKSQLATHTGLSIPAISKILDELVGEGKLSHYSENLSSRGMNSGHYQIPKEGPLILCMNVTPTSIENQLIDAQMTPVGEFLQTQINAPTPEHLLSAIEALWREQQKKCPGRQINLALGVHGQVDPDTGVSQTMPQAPWKKPIEIKYLLEERLGVSVRVDNDCIMLALAEKWQNSGNRQDFCIVNVDYGIGSSFVINGQIYRGMLNGSGQIGHTIFDRDGTACDCGRYGCLETVASLSALKKQARVWLKSQPISSGLDPENMTSSQLIDAWHNGDEQVVQWVEEAANAIGLTLYNLLNILNINQIWFYGRSCEFGDRWLQTIYRQIGFTPFDQGDAVRMRQTQIGFGNLTRQQQITGIGYLYVEAALAHA